MYKRTDEEQERINEFIELLFPEGFEAEKISASEAAILKGVESYVGDNFKSIKYVLGLAIDFSMLAQALANIDPWAQELRKDLTEKQLFERYELVNSVGKKTANTLSLRFKKSKLGIRKFVTL